MVLHRLWPGESVAAAGQPDRIANGGRGLHLVPGNFASVDVPAIAWLTTHALYLHRGPLIHGVLLFPSGRLTSGLDRAAVAVGYVAATVTPIARNEIATILLGALVVAVAVRGYLAAIGASRRTRRLAVRAAIAVGIALSGVPWPDWRSRPAPPTRPSCLPLRRCCARSPWAS
jgi:hypothetical protein